MSRQRVIGVTKCPRCAGQLEGTAVFVRIVEEHPWRTSVTGHAYRSVTPVKVEQRWHQTCWDDELRALQGSHLRAEVLRLEIIEQVAAELGQPVRPALAAELAAAREALARFEAEAVA